MAVATITEGIISVSVRVNLRKGWQKVLRRADFSEVVPLVAPLLDPGNLPLDVGGSEIVRLTVNLIPEEMIPGKDELGGSVLLEDILGFCAEQGLTVLPKFWPLVPVAASFWKGENCKRPIAVPGVKIVGARSAPFCPCLSASGVFSGSRVVYPCRLDTPWPKQQKWLFAALPADHSA